MIILGLTQAKRQTDNFSSVLRIRRTTSKDDCYLDFLPCANSGSCANCPQIVDSAACSDPGRGVAGAGSWCSLHKTGLISSDLEPCGGRELIMDCPGCRDGKRPSPPHQESNCKSDIKKSNDQPLDYLGVGDLWCSALFGSNHHWIISETTYKQQHIISCQVL